MLLYCDLVLTRSRDGSPTVIIRNFLSSTGVSNGFCNLWECFVWIITARTLKEVFSFCLTSCKRMQWLSVLQLNLGCNETDAMSVVHFRRYPLLLLAYCLWDKQDPYSSLRLLNTYLIWMSLFSMNLVIQQRILLSTIGFNDVSNVYKTIWN